MNKYLLLTSTVLAFAAAPAFADDDAFADRALGNVWGVRDTLANHGVDVSLAYTGTAWYVDGGLKDGSNYKQLLTARADVDSAEAFGIKGNSVSVAVQSTMGGHPNNRVGSIEDFEGNTANPNAVRLYEAYVMQDIIEGSLTAIAGVRDLNDDFNWTDMTANFIKPSLQLGQEIAQSGQNGPAVYPLTALGATLVYKPTTTTYVNAAVYDGVPQDPDHPRSPRFDLNGDDGAMLLAEGGYVSENGMNKLGIGAWQYTGVFPDLVDVKAGGVPVKRHQNGIYVVSSYQFYNDEAAGRTLGAFLRAGIADGDTVQTDWNYQIGAVANGWVPSRPNAEIGFAATQAHNSDKYRIAAAPTDESEHGFELYYLDQLARGVTIQPDLQYVVNPGTDTVTDDALIVGLRLGINF